MEFPHVLIEAIAFLFATVVVVPLFERLRASPLVGYLLVGLALGPRGLGWVADVERVRQLAEFGIVVLLFTIGLELTMDRLKVMQRRVLGLGLAQIGLTGLAIAGLAVWAGLGAGGALVLGGALAFSSTAVVVQLLVERHEMATRLGRAALAILLLQDVALGPLLVLVPVLGGEPGSLWVALGTAGGKALVVLAGIIIGGHWVLRPLFRMVAGSKAPELFMAVILFAIVVASLASAMAGLSMTLGAFVAGAMLAETEHRHRILVTIQPFRGLLMGLFFMSIGMVIDLDLAGERFGLLMAILFGLLALKAAILAAATHVCGMGWVKSIRLGLLLAQGSELSFVLLDLAMGRQVLAGDVGQLVMAAVVLSMALTPLLAAAGGRLSRRFEASEAPGIDGIAQAAAELDHHVVIAGLGRTGRSVAERFAERGVPFLVIESNRAKVVEAHGNGLPVFHADAADFQVIEAAGAARAQAVIVALGEAREATHLVATLRYLFPELRILARAKREAQGRALIRAGANEVVVEIQDAGDRLAGAVAVSVDL